MLSRLGLHVAAVTLALTTAGCSFSYQLDSLFEKNKQASGETTGAVAEKAATALARRATATLPMRVRRRRKCSAAAAMA